MSSEWPHKIPYNRRAFDSVSSYICDPDGYIIEVGQTTLARGLASTVLIGSSAAGRKRRRRRYSLQSASWRSTWGFSRRLTTLVLSAKI
jgi:hypothetical protein